MSFSRASSATSASTASSVSAASALEAVATAFFAAFAIALASSAAIAGVTLLARRDATVTAVNARAPIFFLYIPFLSSLSFPIIKFSMS